jgi:hypothetical protein
MKYQTPSIVKVISASEGICGRKGAPFTGDLIDPTSAPYFHTLNAYEADE